MTEFVFNCPSENQVRDYIGYQNAKAGILKVFGWKECRESALHEKLSVRDFGLVLFVGGQTWIEGWVRIQGMVDSPRLVAIGQICARFIRRPVCC